MHSRYSFIFKNVCSFSFFSSLSKIIFVRITWSKKIDFPTPQSDYYMGPMYALADHTALKTSLGIRENKLNDPGGQKSVSLCI